MFDCKDPGRAGRGWRQALDSVESVWSAQLQGEDAGVPAGGDSMWTQHYPLPVATF